MPAMLRWGKRAIKIAYKIMGVPANIRTDAEKTKSEKKVNKRLVFEETSRVR
jgi:hypothetical protein